DDMAVFAWTPDADKPRRRLTLKSPAVGVAFLADGKEAVAADGLTCYVIDLATNSVKRTLVNPMGGVQAIAVAHDAKHILTVATDGQLRWWDIAKDVPERTIDFGMQTPDCLAITNDGKTAAIGTRNGELVTCNIATGSILKKWIAHPGGIATVA